MEKIILAYCVENQLVAAKIALALNGKITTEKVVFDNSTGIEALRRAATSNTHPVLLLLSDNFLKSEKCMNEAQTIVQSLGTAQRLIAVTTEGNYNQNGHLISAPTSFDRVSNVIQYMNYWQDRYLELRRVKADPDDASTNEKIRIIRTISSEVGELLRYLRSTEYYSFDQFEESNYIILYRVLNLPIPEDLGLSQSKAAVHHTVIPAETAVFERKQAQKSQYAPYNNDATTVLEPELALAHDDFDSVHALLAKIAHGGNGNNGNGHSNDNQDDLTPPPVSEDITISANVSSPEMPEIAPSEPVMETLDMSLDIENHDIQVVDNQHLISDFDSRATELINDGLDKPTMLENIIADLKEDRHYHLTDDISTHLDKTVDAVVEEEATSVFNAIEPKPIGNFTLEEILKDDELRELVESRGDKFEKKAARTIIEREEHKLEPIIIHLGQSTGNGNGNGHHSLEHLNVEDDDLVRKIAAEAIDSIDNTPIIHSEIAAEQATDIIENPVAKRDADLHKATEIEDLTTDKTEVMRIFDRAEQADTHFEFEEETPAPVSQMIEISNAQVVENHIIADFIAEITENTEGVATPVIETVEVVEMPVEAAVSEPIVEIAAPVKETIHVTENSISDFHAHHLNTHLDSNDRYRLAAALAQQGKLTEATEQLELLLENDRKNVEAYLLLSYLAEQQGDYTLSLNSLEKVSLLRPDYMGIYYKLGRVTQEHFKKQSRKAMRYFQDAITQEPANADAQYRYAMMLIEQSGDYPKAIEHLNTAINADSQHENAVFELAKAYIHVENRQDGAKWYARATALNPTLKTDTHDEFFHYDEPKIEPEPTPQIVNDNGMTALITGATSGIGRATAEIFARQGYRLILTGRRAERLEETKTYFETTYHNKIHLLNFDVRSLEAVKTAVNSLEEEWRNVDILINNAGLASGFAPIHEGDVSDWELMIDTNIKGLLYMTRAIAPQMVARRKGHIINVGSIAGKEIYPNGNIYIATKHAVDALTRAMRVDLYKYGIRVGQIAPGMVEDTEFALVRFHGDAEKAKIYEDIMPLKASDVAETIFFMVSRPDYVNIQDIVLMGKQQANSILADRSGRSDK